jgi:hypothetical protein
VGGPCTRRPPGRMSGQESTAASMTTGGGLSPRRTLSMPCLRGSSPGLKYRENSQDPVWKVRQWQRSAAGVLAPRQPCRSGPLAQTHIPSVPVSGKGFVATPTLAGNSRFKHCTRNNLFRRFLTPGCPSARKAWGCGSPLSVFNLHCPSRPPRTARFSCARLRHHGQQPLGRSRYCDAGEPAGSKRASPTR